MAFVTDCDYCGNISLCKEDGAGGKGCSSCLNKPQKDRREEIAERLAKIEEEFEYMRQNYEGCDWCCGGGDEWWEANTEEKARLTDELDRLNPEHYSKLQAELAARGIHVSLEALAMADEQPEMCCEG